MKDSRLGYITPYSFKGKLVIAIADEWKNFFEDDPEFEVVIKEGRYSLLGPKVCYNPNRDTPNTTEDKHV